MSNITKKKLVEKVSIRTGLTQIDTKIVLECFLDALSNSLEQGNGIEIRGFGRFKIKEKKARTARNPRTNEPVEVQGGYKPIFEPSRELKKRVNDSLLKK
ncbi:MAG: integration host factor subunit beta [Chitinispirillia bacterium]|nr:integration host factor subunit beta [Chitinispirillia bacterium]MCL2241680.1 integration host factor subunit beta [Chitinispirillia bacterium]